MNLGRVLLTACVFAAAVFAHAASAASYSLVPGSGEQVSGSDRAVTLSVPTRAVVPLKVEVQNDANGNVVSYLLSRPARIGVQTEFVQYLEGMPWEKTRLQLENSLGASNLEFVILESPNLIEAINNGSVDMAVTDAGNFIRFEMTGQLIGLSSLWPVSTPDPSYADGVLFVKRASSKEINTLVDARNRLIGASYPTSFGGWLIALREFQWRGLNTEVITENTRFYGTDPTNIMRALSQEKVDLAVLPTCAFESLVKKGVIDEADYAFLNVKEVDYSACRHSGDLYPSFIISSFEGTDPVFSRAITAALQHMTGASTGVDWGPVASTRAVHDLYYALKVGPYEHLQAFRLSTFIREQSAGVTFTLGVIFLIVFLCRLALSTGASANGAAESRAGRP